MNQITHDRLRTSHGTSRGRNDSAAPVLGRGRKLLGNRTAALALYLGYPLLIASLWSGSTLQHHGHRALALVMLIPLALAVAAVLSGGYALLSRSAINLPNLADGVLDERQRAVRDSAYRAAFRSLSAVLLLAALYATPAAAAGWPLPRGSEALQAVFWGLFILTATLPTAIIAWMEPDEGDER